MRRSSEGTDRSRRHRGGRVLWRRRERRPPPDIPVDEMRERMSSYIYGNITVAGAAISVGPEQIEHGAAVWVVLATGVLTFAAHVLSHAVAHGFGESAEENSDSARRAAMTEVVSRARPIVTSALIPALLYATAWLGWLSPGWGQLAAVVVLAVRISIVGVFMEQYSGRNPTMSGLWGGIVLAVVAFGIGLAKVLLTH